MTDLTGTDELRTPLTDPKVRLVRPSLVGFERELYRFLRRHNELPVFDKAVPDESGYDTKTEATLLITS